MDERRLAIVVFLIAAAAPSRAVAEAPAATLQAGSRIRVTQQDGSSVIGQLVSQDEGRLRLQADQQAAAIDLERAKVKKVEVSAGPRSRGRTARQGAIIGAGVGAGFILVALLACGDFCEDAEGGEYATVLLGGGLVGGGLGAAIGAGVGGGERWRAVPTEGVRVGLTAGRERGLGLRVSVGF